MSKFLNKNIIVILIAGLLFFLMGLFAGKQLVPATTAVKQLVQQPIETDQVKKGSYDDGYQAGLDYARKRLRDEGLIQSSFVNKASEANDKSGKTITVENEKILPNVNVKSVKGRDIEIEFEASLLDIFQEGKLTKTMKLPSGVNIEKHIPKDSEKHRKEIDEYNEKSVNLVNKGDLIKFPLSYIIEYLEPGDLEDGDMLRAFSNDDMENDTFEATKVEIVSFTFDESVLQKKEDKDVF